ncbi:helix-turn-helix domain-containing protein [Streptosporangium amethystogenes subsp. fukuiense]|uniref:Helix-turn-helix domain-containing protein n=1 Tax=Streptosporangium amethystogenes subsp. fukuiense TaxID=698418 RepID=A0ABW2T8P7_9ACTN
MGRRERPLDPAGGPVPGFAYALRKLRQEAGGLTYRDMARRVGCSVTTLSQAAAGERLPSLQTVLAYVEACGGDLAEWETRWRDVTAELAREMRDDDGAVPSYLGLASYDAEDAARFFGRERLVREVVDLLELRRFVAVFGPSGSGKSSLLRAGVVPALRTSSSPPKVVVITPGDHPMRHADRLRADESAGGSPVVVVDQFEEVFTLCRDRGERAEFVDMLVGARRPASALRVIIAVRADFYGRCGEHRELAESLRDTGLLVGAMTRDELREAIVRPAMADGLTVERALTAAIIADVADEPGALPLMSHALRETWRRRRGKMLTLDAYESVGGVRGATGHTAEELYGRLSPAQARIARRVLLRLINPGEQAEDTRRPVSRAELDPLGDVDTGLVIELLAGARLLTLHQDTVEVAHEALIGAWPRLRGWVDEGRDRLRAHRQLSQAAASWAEHGHDAGALYRGAHLTVAEKLLAESEHRDDLTPLENDFLRASAARARRASRLRSGIVAALAVLLIISVAASVGAVRQADLARGRLEETTARLVAQRAATLRLTDPGLARRLSAAAWRISPVSEARGELVDSMASPMVDAFTDPYGTAGSLYTLSSDGAELASYTPGRTGEPGTLRVHDLARKKQVADVRWDREVMALAFRPGTRTVAVADLSGVWLWSVHGPAPSGSPLVSWQDPGLPDMWFSPSGRFLTISGVDATETWDVERQTRVLSEEVVHISPDDRLALVIPPQARDLVAEVTSGSDAVATGGSRSARRLELWDPVRGERVDAPWLPSNATTGAFSPDGRLLAVSAHEDGVLLFDVSTGKKTTEAAMYEPAERLEFSGDGRFLTGTDTEDRVNLWSVRKGMSDGTLLTSLPLPPGTLAPLHRISHDGRLLRVADPFGTVQTYDLSAHTTALGTFAPGDNDERRFSPDGRLLAVATGKQEGWQVKIWDVATRKPLGAAIRPDDPPLSGDQSLPGAGPYSPVFSPDGRTLALIHAQSTTVTLWDVATRTRTGDFTVRRQSADGVRDLVFSPDGGTVAVSSFFESQDDVDELELWDVGSRTWLRSIGTEAAGVAFLPDGRRLLAREGSFLTDTRRSPGTEGAVLDLVTGKVSPYQADARARGEVLLSRNAAATGDASGRVTFWTGELREQLAPPQVAHTMAVSALVPYPPGDMFASVSDKDVMLWEWHGHRQIGSRVELTSDLVATVAFNRTALLISHQDGRLLEITVAPNTAAAAICAKDGALSRPEWNAHIPELPYLDTCRGGRQ